MPWNSSSEQATSSDRHPGCSLPEEVVKKIKQVDQQTSTLTAAGITGFSARILDKSEYRMEQRGMPGTGEIVVVQLVEIIKKPGQSLGLYLREGNGADRPCGVFASRFGANSELEKYGDIIRPGDEILSVNNVDVSTMSIDDVVLVLSIPRRLLLRTRFVKNKRERISQSQSMTARPVVVFQKSEADRPAESSSSSLLTNPTSTANTWLGKKARQQQELAKRCSQPSCSGDGPDSQVAFSPRVAGTQSSRPLIGQRADVQLEETVSRTARVPPPKIVPTITRYSDSFSGLDPIAQQNLMYNNPYGYPPMVQPCAPRPMSMSTCGPSNFGYSGVRPITGPAPATGRPVLIGQRSMSDVAGYTMHRSVCSPSSGLVTDNRFPYRTLGSTTVWGSGGGDANDIVPSKSNSLPRRRPITGGTTARTVKWRNDVTGGGGIDCQKGAAIASSSYGRTIDDIFSAQEYRNWAGIDSGGIRPFLHERQSRWSHTYGERPGASIRSSSLPSRAILANPSRFSLGHERGDLLDKLHVSPLMNRRVPLRAAGPGFDVDTPINVNSLTGILVVQILEGRGLKMPDKQKAFTEEMYCVLEINETHRARTGVSTAEQKFKWRETFEIDVQHATYTNFFVYSWHPQYRHKLCHKGSLKLLEAFIVDRLNGNRMFALNLEPKGQLIVRIAFHNVAVAFRRTVNCRYDGVFGVPLQRLIAREGRETPMVLTRLLQEIEHRGVDYAGLYILCGSVEKKRILRDEIEMGVERVELSVDAVPDTNVLTCLVKDFLRELPEPLVSTSIHGMLLEAISVTLPNDSQGNRRLLLRVIDCLPTPNKNTLIQVMDHLKMVISSESHNGVTSSRLTSIFGSLLFCTSDISPGTPQGVYPTKLAINPLDTDQAARTLSLLLEVWPSRVNSSESSTSDSAEATNATSAVSESQC